MSADPEKEKIVSKNLKEDQSTNSMKSSDEKDSVDKIIHDDKTEDGDKEALKNKNKILKDEDLDDNEDDGNDNKNGNEKDNGINNKTKTGNDKEKDVNDGTMSLAEIAKINENITKTRVEGLQTLHMICFDNIGKFYTVKKNLRKFSGFDFDVDSDKYKEKLALIEKNDIKALKGVCDVLDLEKKGSKEEISETILKFLIAPDGEPEQEQDDEEEIEEEEEEEEQSEEDDRRKRKRSGAQTKSTTARPRRATAGKSNRDFSSYVDYSSEDSEQKAPVTKRRKRKDDSDSGSDYNPSGAGSDSDTGRKKQPTRQSGRGRPPVRKSRRRNSDDDESVSSEEESDEPKKKRGGKSRGRPPTRGRRAKKEETESEEEVEDEEESELGSEESDDEPKNRRSKSGVKNNKHSNKNKSTTPAKAPGRPKKSVKAKKDESSEEVEEEDYKEVESEDEPLAKKSKPTPPTDEEIKIYVKEILDEANLEEITMKTVCKQVYAKYPDFDLTDKKDFIKATVKSLIAA